VTKARARARPGGLDLLVLAAAQQTTFRTRTTTVAASRRIGIRTTELTFQEETSMQKESLRELYIDELRGLYNAEIQLVKALPKMAKAAASGQLRQAFEEHLRQTSEHVSRLEQIFEQLEKKPSGRRCLGMVGLVKQGAETMGEDYAEDVMDAAIIGAAQRVEHYEISAYGTVRAFAELLGENEHVSLLKQTLEEERQTDRLLTDLSQEINSKEAQGEAGSSTPSDESRSSSKSKKAA
jgi:ferritin-like metal-binding protein YciE